MVLVSRGNIGIFGRTNVGKSTIMNHITSQPVSLVDKKAGTTADINKTIMELHELGPVKLFDTAGMDELSALGEKKKSKSHSALKESDLVLLVINPYTAGELLVEKEILSLTEAYRKQLLIIYNIFKESVEGDYSEVVEACQSKLKVSAQKLVIDASSKDAGPKLIEFIQKNYKKRSRAPELLPFLNGRKLVALNIPIDEETPGGRLLRPQNAVVDSLLRRFIPFAGFRMDLKKARSKIDEIREEHKREYLDFLKELDGESLGLQLVVTDSQAIDIITRWTPAHIPITTFSIIMIHRQSGGNLKKFVEGIKAIESLGAGDPILIAEACNHNRICDDIGTMQIPGKLRTYLKGKEPEIDFIFGRPFPSKEEMRKYKLIVHCGGCMVDQQKIGARIEDLERTNTPITNYGILLSYLEGKDALRRVLEPWGLEI